MIKVKKLQKLTQQELNHAIHINFCLLSGNQELINCGSNNKYIINPYILYPQIRQIHCHHLRPYHSRSFPHNQSRNLPFHYVVETEIHSNLEFKMFGQSISTDLDHLQYFKNNTLALISDLKAYFNCTNFCKHEDLQSS